MISRLFPGTDTRYAMDMEINKRMTRTPDLQVMTEQGDQLVFVYGTLKKGYHNHAVLGYNPKYLGKGRTSNMQWVMYDTGSFPVVMKTAEVGNYIYGEIYAVPARQMLSLDALESNGVMYKREKVKVRFIDQKEKSDLFEGELTPNRDIWMYVGCPDYWDNEDRLTIIDRQLVTGMVSGAYYRSF